MTRLMLSLLLALFALCFRPTTGTSSVLDFSVSGEVPASELQDKPEFEHDFVVGLTLSGGGAAGLAHIGVLKVFEEAGIPVDLVTGTSMGAVVGALYSIGYTPQQIEKVALQADWRQLFEERIERQYLPMEEKKYDGLFNLSFPVEGTRIQLPTGLVSGNHIFNMLAILTWPYHDQDDFLRLPRPFLCIATDIETGEQVILDHGFLPDAIRASMSIPSIFDPVWTNGKYLVDGGVMNNLPVQEAVNLGADFVIAVNSSSDLKPARELNSLPDILTQTIAVGMRASMQVQSKKANFYIQPDLRHFTTLSFGEVEKIIRAGELAARERIDEIKQLADSLNALRSDTYVQDIPEFEPLETIRIRSVDFMGVRTVPVEHLRSKLQIWGNMTIDGKMLSEGLMRLYGMQRFKRVTYRLKWNNEKEEADLVIYVEEQTANSIQTGIHHNSLLGPSLLFNTTFRNLVFPASTARLNIRVGYETMAEAEYFNYVGIEPRLSFHGTAGYRERELDIYRNGRREAGVKTDILYSEGLIGPLYASVVRAGFGYRFEYFNLTESIGFIDVPDDWTHLHLLAGELEFDNLDRSNLPRVGHHIQLRTEISPDFLPNKSRFGKIYGSWSGHFAASGRLSLQPTLRGGYSFGDGMPLHYRYYSGGYQKFAGYRKDAIAGNNIIYSRLAAQYRFYRQFYLTPVIDLGNTYNRLNMALFDTPLKWGWATAISWNTALGPIEAILMGSRDNPVLFEFRLGMNF